MERPTEESRWLAVLERVAERLLRSSIVDLGTGTLGSSRYLLYFVMWYLSYKKMRVQFVITFKIVIGLCCFSPLP